ncbi:hypothetical protein FGO68_gene14348 [Halteria grandinella]|uniref:Uncharacterized protein n=1 Tax=Halteria grandinella TaxID=5974 RepID=A0A8J8NZZ7_HALGN|nr:hypothetical protein FGO68_gene14348 [Halteria grandinella]
MNQINMSQITNNNPSNTSGVVKEEGLAQKVAQQVLKTGSNTQQSPKVQASAISLDQKVGQAFVNKLSITKQIAPQKPGDETPPINRVYKQVVQELTQPLDQSELAPHANDERELKIHILKDKCFKLSQALDKALLSQRESQLQLLQLQQQHSQQVEAMAQQSQRQTVNTNAGNNSKEIVQLANLVQTLKRDNDMLRIRLENKQEFSRHTELEDKVKEKDLLIAQLTKEVKSLQRIQLDQGKALYKITNEHDYPQKIRMLMEELRIAREKNVQMEERLKREERHALQAQERMVGLEERCRDMQNRLRVQRQESNNTGLFSQNNDYSDQQQYQDTLESIPEHAGSELQRANLILIRAKESQYKKGQYMKLKYEKKIMQMQLQLDQMAQHLIERDKEIKLYRMKLKDMVNSTNDEGKFQSVQGTGGLRLLSIDVGKQGRQQQQQTQRVTAISTEMESAKLPQSVTNQSTLNRTRARSIDPTAKKQAYYLGPANAIMPTKPHPSSIQSLQDNNILTESPYSKKTHLVYDSTSETATSPVKSKAPSQRDLGHGSLNVRDLDRETEALLEKIRLQNSQLLEDDVNKDQLY